MLLLSKYPIIIFIFLKKKNIHQETLITISMGDRTCLTIHKTLIWIKWRWSSHNDLCLFSMSKIFHHSCAHIHQHVLLALFLSLSLTHTNSHTHKRCSRTRVNPKWVKTTEFVNLDNVVRAGGHGRVHSVVWMIDTQRGAINYWQSCKTWPF